MRKKSNFCVYVKKSATQILDSLHKEGAVQGWLRMLSFWLCLKGE